MLLVLIDGDGGQIIMFSDLETDYINPIDFCNKMNKVRSGLGGFVVGETGLTAVPRSLCCQKAGRTPSSRCSSSLRASGSRSSSTYRYLRTTLTSAPPSIYACVNIRLNITVCPVEQAGEGKPHVRRDGDLPDDGAPEE